MNWGRHLDEYCERVSTAFWAEPLNAVSNIAFLVAAVAVWRMLRADGRVPPSIGFMAPHMAVIGVGSFAFHTIATAWARMLDSTPIQLFVLAYLAAFLRWFYGLARRWCLLAAAAFAASCVGFGLLAGAGVPNGSGTYVPVLLLMAGLTVALRTSRDPDRARHWPSFAVATGVFAAALLARTVDQAVCAAVPIGTHFLWHALDGLLLGLVARALVRRFREVSPADRRSGKSAVGAR